MSLCSAQTFRLLRAAGARESTECDQDKSHTTLQGAERQLRGDFTRKQVNTNYFSTVVVSLGAGSW